MYAHNNQNRNRKESVKAIMFEFVNFARFGLKVKYSTLKIMVKHIKCIKHIKKWCIIGKKYMILDCMK